MNEQTRAWRGWTMALGVAVLVAAAGAALGFEVLEQASARRLQVAKALGDDLQLTQRRLDSARAEVAATLQPDWLRTHAPTGLGPVGDKQIVWVSPPSRQPPPDQAPAPQLNWQFAVSDLPATPTASPAAAPARIR